MKTVKSFLSWAFLAVLLLCALSVIRPYWNRYWIHKDMETAAVYGTKHSEEATMGMLLKKMQQEGHKFTEQNFVIDKEANNKVTITLQYTDRIGLFGVEFKKLPFTLTASAKEIKEYY
jgi:hypothetical protein